jgi:hypothetical protein
MTMNRLLFIWLSWATAASPAATTPTTSGTINNDNAVDISMNSTNTTTISAKLVPVSQSLELELWFPTARRKLDIPIETAVFEHLSQQYLRIQDVFLNRFEILSQRFGPAPFPSPAASSNITASSRSSSNGIIVEAISKQNISSSPTRYGIGGSISTTAALMPETISKTPIIVVVIGPASMLQEPLAGGLLPNILTVLIEVEAWNVQEIQPLLHGDWNSYLDLLLIGLDEVFDDIRPSFTTNTTDKPRTPTSSLTRSSRSHEQRYWTRMGTALGLSLAALAMVVAVRRSGRHGHLWRHHLMMEDEEGVHNNKNHGDDEDDDAEMSTLPKNDYDNGNHDDDDDDDDIERKSSGETPSSLGDGGPSVYFDHPPFFPEAYYNQTPSEDPIAATPTRIPSPRQNEELPIEHPPPDGNDDDDECNNNRNTSSEGEQVQPDVVDTMVWI